MPSSCVCGPRSNKKAEWPNCDRYWCTRLLFVLINKHCSPEAYAAGQEAERKAWFYHTGRQHVARRVPACADPYWNPPRCWLHAGKSRPSLPLSHTRE